jgi:hypothetical protein
VFYLPGYDPFPPRRYRELYRSEAAEQARISGYEIAISAGLDDGADSGFGWRVAARIDGQPVRTEIEVLSWSDIVQQSRPTSIVSTYLDLVRTAWIYLRRGTLFQLMQLRKGPVLAALFPVAALLAQAGLALTLGWAMGRVVMAMGPQIVATAPQAGLAAAAVTVGAVTAGVVLRWFRDNDGRFFAYYLMHDFAFSASGNGAYPPPLEARLKDFRTRLRAALDSDADEVLVVGHSSGAHLAVSTIADLLREGDLPPDGPALALLSLGQVVPMVSFLPDASRLRRDLRAVSQRAELAWVDVTAPGDGCCFALCDPVAVTGLASADTRGPLVFSAAFTQSLSPARWKALRWRFFRLHFQYLCAFDRPKDYDYFQITAGPLLLRDRYAARTPSRSVKDKPVNRFRTTAP